MGLLKDIWTAAGHVSLAADLATWVWRGVIAAAAVVAVVGMATAAWGVALLALLFSLIAAIVGYTAGRGLLPGTQPPTKVSAELSETPETETEARLSEKPIDRNTIRKWKGAVVDANLNPTLDPMGLSLLANVPFRSTKTYAAIRQYLEDDTIHAVERQYPIDHLSFLSPESHIRRLLLRDLEALEDELGFRRSAPDTGADDAGL